ncbi:hypothetical protein H8356DRAFT_1737304 [Neocallimastix lanati (nom. inval.)]|jgi:hypothetical protein|nr:hypothetical protein H8356DRAFT_1737304 [Neocallimastix sp. JGI-2020a]
MANNKNLINKLTRGLKFKINKKKSAWKTLNSKDSLPPTPTEEYMLYSDTEAELYQAKANIEANRSFTYQSSSFNNEINNNIGNILVNSYTNNNNNSNNNIFIGRSKTTYSRPSTATFTFNNNTLNRMSTTQSQFPSQSQNKYLYPSATISENRKNSFQTIVASPPPNSNTQPISTSFITPSSSFSLNNTSYVSAPNSPISTDSSDTFVVNDIKISSSNPFRNDINTNTNTNTNNNNNTTNLNRSKATNNEIKNCLTISTDNMDPAMGHTLISPIEFDGSGKEIKSNDTNTVKFNINTNTTNNNKNTNTNTNNSTTKEQPPKKSKSIKRIKPLITFDTPPVVTPITPESDSEENVRGHKRSGKKSKRNSKKLASPLLTLKTTELNKDISKNSYNKFSPESASVIAYKANMRMNSPMEEDDDVPLGIIQYKCLSSLLKESAPTNISSLQSNTKSYKSSSQHVKSSYDYISPSEYYSREKYDYPNFAKYSSYYHENYVI